MAHYGMYDPATSAAPAIHRIDGPCTEYCCYGSGPAGRTTNVEHDEKGILEGGLVPLTSGISSGYMSSNHDSNRVGIYTTNSVGDDD